MLGRHRQWKFSDGITYAIKKYLRAKLGQVVRLPASILLASPGNTEIVR